MFRKNNNKGFTLMEMLIVVAIIAILVAILIPTLTTQLEKAREAADIANIRSAYAEAMINSMTSEDGTGSKVTEKMTQKVAGWEYITWPTYLGTELVPMNGFKTGDTLTVSVGADGKVTVTKTDTQEQGESN